MASLLVVLALPALGARVSGIVAAGGGVLPGCTVRLGTRVAVSDADGRYAFDDVVPGRYDVAFELSGVEPATVSIDVAGDTVVPEQALRLPESEPFVIACAACSESQPQSEFDSASCEDYGIDMALIDAVPTDATALARLVDRYARASTYAERHIIAGALLGHIDDSGIYADLSKLAEDALYFPEPHPDEPPDRELAAFCAARGVSPDRYWFTAYDALSVISNDPRSRRMLFRALDDENAFVVMAAIYGLAAQHDESALRWIERAIGRFADDRQILLGALEEWDSPAAHEVTARLLGSAGAPLDEADANQ